MPTPRSHEKKYLKYRLFGGSCFGFQEDDKVVLEVDEFLGGSLNILGGDRFHEVVVVVDDIVAALVEAVATHDLAHPEAVVLLAVLAVDDLLFLNFGEGLGIGAFVDVFLQDFHGGVLDESGAVGVAVDVEGPVDFRVPPIFSRMISRAVISMQALSWSMISAFLGLCL